MGKSPCGDVWVATLQLGPVFPAWARYNVDKYSSKCDTETKTGLWLTFEMARRPGAPVISAVLVDGLGYLAESNGQYIRDTISSLSGLA